MEGATLRGRPKKTWRELVDKDCNAHRLNRKDTVDRSRWRKQLEFCGVILNFCSFFPTLESCINF